MQAHEVDADTVRARAAQRRGSRPQLVSREQVPKPQGRERNGLRPVRIETEQPRPDQAI
jgi:hypothetical protein